MAQRTFRVVIADDAPAVRLLFRTALEEDGRFEIVAEGANGAEAVEAARVHRPDLTLLDLSMPVMSGLEALPLIRAAVPSSTVVVLSSFDAERMAPRVLEAGAAAYLEKAVAPDDLVAQLMEVLDRAVTEHDGTPPPASERVSDEPQTTTVTLPAQLRSPWAARRFVRDVLREWSRDSLVDDALLLTSELVTNAVVHARSEVELRVLRFANRLRIEVADSGGGSLQLRDVDENATGGRGLFLVKAIALSWGTMADGAKKVVWFEL